MKLKTLVPILLLLGALLGAATLLATSQRLAPALPDPTALAVRVMVARPAPVVMKVHGQGTVEPRVRTALVPEVSGNVVWAAPSFVSGGHFAPGDTLLRIDDRDYRVALGRAEATLSRARAEHEHAEIELQRALELESRRLISRAEVEAAMRTTRIAEASVRDAELALEQAQRELERTEVKAPFTGLVRSQQVDVGQFVSRGNTVAELYAADSLEVRLPLADRQLAYLDVPLGQVGELDRRSAPPVVLSAAFAGREQQWQARLVRTEAEIDPASRMVHAVARVEEGGPGGEPLPPVGLFVHAEIEGHRMDGVIVLPRAALRDGNRVLLVDADNRLRFRRVDVLRVYRDEAYIGGGITAGELIVISPLQTVVEGMRVEPIRPGGGEENGAALEQEAAR